MGLISNIVDKHNHKKCIEAYEKISKGFSTGSTHSFIFMMDSQSGYAELIESLNNDGFDCDIKGDRKQGFYLLVTKPGQVCV